MGHSFLEGDSYTIGLTIGTVPDTPYNNRVAVHLDQLRRTVMGLEHPVYILQDF